MRQKTIHAGGPWALAAILVISIAWATTGPVAADQAGPRVLLFYDMEGVSTVTGARQVSFGSPGYAEARAALTDEVNAVIRGLLRAGASEVILTDGHGSGNLEPDYDASLLPDGARMDVREAPYDAFVDAVGPEIDAVAAVGMHGRAAGGGFLAHTYYAHTRWELAGLEMNESMILAASAARFDVPLILVSGDDVLREEVADFSPATRYVTTKRVLEAGGVEPLPKDEVILALEEAAAEVLTQREEIPAWEPPLQGDPVSLLGYTLPDHAAVAIHYPGARPVNDRTIALDAEGFLASYLQFRALAHFTILAPLRKLQTALMEVEGGREVLMRVRRSMSIRPAFEPQSETLDETLSAMGRHGYR